MKVDIYIREANQDDLSFIQNSWIRSFRKSVLQINDNIYGREQHKLVNKLISRSNCWLACNPDELYQIYGYIIFEKLAEIGIMHYVYVKSPYRRYGIATRLFKMIEHDSQYPCIVTHYTQWNKHLGSWNLTWNPYYLIGDRHI